MANNIAYQQGIEICKQNKEKAKYIALAVVKDEAKAEKIVSEACVEFLKECYHHSLPEKANENLIERVYQTACVSMQSIQKSAQEEITNKESDEEDVVWPTENTAPKEKQNVFSTPIVETVSESHPDFVNKEEFDISDAELENFIFPISENEELPMEPYISTADAISPLAKQIIHTPLSAEEEHSTSNSIDARIDKIIENEASQDSIYTVQKPSLNKKKFIILTVVFAIIILLILWLLCGLLINAGYIPPIDLGYSWFNENIFRAFFLT